MNDYDKILILVEIAQNTNIHSERWLQLRVFSQKGTNNVSFHLIIYCYIL